MSRLTEVTARSLWAGIGMAAILAAGCAGMPPSGITITLTKCAASTTSLSCPQAFGTVTTSGFVGTAAHIHRGKAGQNGPVIIPLVKTGENSWAVPDRTFVSDSDFGGYQDGELYVNVHSANNPNGEVRGQLVP